MCRGNFKEILKVMEYNESSLDSFTTSDEDDIDFLLCKLAFRPKR